MQPLDPAFHHLDLARLSKARSRSISAENPTGGKGMGAMAVDPKHVPSRELGKGWKVRPCVELMPGQTLTLCDITGPGVIQQMWMCPSSGWKALILRVYWDDQERPAVEVPFGDFFCCGFSGIDGNHNHNGANFRQMTSQMICFNPGSSVTSNWQMPFRKRCRMTLENIHPGQGGDPNCSPTAGKSVVYWQINYAETEVPDDIAYFHAQFRRSNPVKDGVHTLLDGVKGQGHYVGTSMAWSVKNNAWWGEGEIKFYMDGDGEYPTICGTGTEDYFGGSYNFDLGKENGGYKEYCNPYLGLHQVLKPDGLYQSQMRFGMYRWHVTDPIRFEKDLRVTIQALGWRQGWRYLVLQDDVASVSYWYQTLPTAPFPKLPSLNELEVI
jgi:hypothetical protein